MTVHKYVLAIRDVVLLALPAGAKPLHVAEQAGQLCLWALVDPDKKLTKRTFRVVGTGQSAPAKGYVGTALLHGGSLVLHVFEEA